MQEGTICVCFSSAVKSLFSGRYEGGTSLVGSSISLEVSVSKSRAALAPPTTKPTVPSDGGKCRDTFARLM